MATTDSELTLFWYDCQGCIEAEKMNIIEELPLLVLIIRIFEDFPLGVWGYTPIDVWTEDENKKKVYYAVNKNLSPHQPSNLHCRLHKNSSRNPRSERTKMCPTSSIFILRRTFELYSPRRRGYPFSEIGLARDETPEGT